MTRLVREQTGISGMSQRPASATLALAIALMILVVAPQSVHAQTLNVLYRIIGIISSAVTEPLRILKIGVSGWNVAPFSPRAGNELVLPGEHLIEWTPMAPCGKPKEASTS